jgi:hypothetical protein
MLEKNDERPVPGWVRAVLVVVLAGFAALQGYTTFGPGGIADKYTAVTAFTQFDDLMLADPLTAAGLYDFLFLTLAFIVIVLNGVPRGPRYGLTCVLLITLTFVFPGAGALVFLLLYWRRLGQFRP